MKKLSPEESGDRPDRKEESALRRDELLVFAESSTEDDGMNVRMKGKVASPGMENADETNLCTQMSFVLGKFLQGRCTAVIEQVEEKTPVGKKEAVELLGYGENSVEVRRINYIGFPGIDPFLLVQGLTAGAVPVTAGIIVNFGGAAVLADCRVAAKKSRFAPDDGNCSLMGHGTDRDRLAIMIIGLRENILNGIAHGTHRTSKGLTAFPMPVRARWT